MMPEDFAQILLKDKRYKTEAYLFVLSALSYTLAKIGQKRHLTGQELLQGIKELAKERYGLMAKEVFAHWGVHRTIDFGHIVFNLVEARLLSKTDEDKIEDFKDIYDFEEVFFKDYSIFGRTKKNEPESG